MSFKQTVRHEASRSGGLPESRAKRPAYVPYGQIAYASAYGKLGELERQRDEARLIRSLQGHKSRDWVVERQHSPSGEWIAADKSLQCSSFEQACRFVSGTSYRVRRLYGRRGH